MNENNQAPLPAPNATPAQQQTAGTDINTHFTLAVIALLLSCFAGFLTIALALAALIFSLRAKDQLQKKQTEEAQQMAVWAGIFGWISLLIILLPAVIFGAIALFALLFMATAA